MKLKLQYFGHLMRRTNSLQKILMLGRLKAGEGDDRRWDGWIAWPTQWTWVWASSGSWWWTGRPGMLQSTGSQRVGHDWATELSCQRVFFNITNNILKSANVAWFYNVLSSTGVPIYLSLSAWMKYLVLWPQHLPVDESIKNNEKRWLRVCFCLGYTLFSSTQRFYYF